MSLDPPWLNQYFPRTILNSMSKYYTIPGTIFYGIMPFLKLTQALAETKFVLVN